MDVLEFERPVYDQYLLPHLFPDVSAGRPVRLVVDVPWGAVFDAMNLCTHVGFESVALTTPTGYVAKNANP